MKFRIWLCGRSLDGSLIIKRCLAEADSDEVFGDVCAEWEGSRGWITLFVEEKKDDEEFQPINKNTIVIFCKLYKPDKTTMIYLGHLLVERTAPCSELLASITRMAKLSNKTEFSLYIEKPRFGLRIVTEFQSSLAEVLMSDVMFTTS